MNKKGTIMKIQALGVGGAFSPQLGNSSFIIWNDKKTDGTLVDCGSSVFAILESNQLIDKINTVFITHLHSDHAGSLDTFLQYRRFVSKKKTRVLELPRVLKYLREIDPGYEDNLREYFDMTPANYEWDSYMVKHCPNMEARALGTKDILISGDTDSSLLSITAATAKKTKVIFHDVSFKKRPSKDDVHAHYLDLVRAKDSVKAKTWLYHYNYGDFSEYSTQVKRDGFAGLLMTGQEIVLLEE